MHREEGGREKKENLISFYELARVSGRRKNRRLRR